MANMATPYRTNPSNEVMKFTIFVMASLLIITIYLVYLLYAHACRSREECF